MTVVYGWPVHQSKRHRFGVRVEVQRRGAASVVDGYEEPGMWGTAFFAEGCAVAPGAVVEDFEPNREGVGVEFTVYMPPGVVVRSGDRLVLPGHSDPFEVKGAPHDWGLNPFGGTPAGVVVEVGRFDG